MVITLPRAQAAANTSSSRASRIVATRRSYRARWRGGQRNAESFSDPFYCAEQLRRRFGLSIRCKTQPRINAQLSHDALFITPLLAVSQAGHAERPSLVKFSLLGC